MAAGFSLIEVLVAMGLLAGSLVSLIHVLVVAARANLEARHVTYATILAAQKIEELRAVHRPTAGEDRSNGYVRRWLIAPLSSEADAPLTIEVSVTPGAVRLATIVATRAP